MVNMTIKNIPDDLHAKLKERAALHRRSLNSEVLLCLEREVQMPRPDKQTILDAARTMRNKTSKIFLTEEMLRKIKNEGRP